MDKLSKGLKAACFIAVLALYFALIWVGMSVAEPRGATVTNLSTVTGPVRTAGNRSDAGGTITTISIDSVNQVDFWKAYVGNITGALVLQNAEGQSIYEWALDASSFSGAIYVTRSIDLNWSALRCANRSQISSEDSALGILQSYSVNRTFNNSVHKILSTTIGSVPSIAANSCNSTVTYYNGSSQILNDSSKFQEILLSDESDLIYATFIDQDSLGYDANSTFLATHDFQLIVPVNLTTVTYYFYADIN